jgi:hypothetical protein
MQIRRGGAICPARDTGTALVLPRRPHRIDRHANLDSNQSRSVKAGITHKLPRSNLVADAEFELSWCPMRFDYALAQSVFISLPLKFLRVCLERLPTFVVPGGRFLVSLFIIPDDHRTGKPCMRPSKSSTISTRHASLSS